MRRVPAEIWALLAVQFLFATNAVVGKLNVTYLGPQLLVLLRILGAAAVFLALAYHSGIALPRARRDLALLALCGVLGVALNQSLYLTGLSYSTATNATIINTSIPVFTMAVAAVFGQERLSLGKILGLALALAGALFLAHVESFRLSRATVGDLLFVANSCSYGCYLVLSRSLVRRHGARAQIIWTFAFGALLVLPYGVPGLAVLGSPSAKPWWLWLSVPYTIIFPTVLAYFLNAFALRKVESSAAATWIYLQPLIAIALAVPLLGERPSPRTGVAALLIFGGVLLSTRGAVEATVGGDPVTP